MLNTMLKKWWVILLQGILMFILGLLILNNPMEVLSGISLWFGILILLTVIIGIFGWLFSSGEERDTGSLIWSLLSAVFGIIILTNLSAAMKVVTIIFGIWVFLIGINLLISGLSIKKENALGWFLVITGVISLIAGVMMIFNIGSGAAGIATILGVQVLLAGIALILLSIIKKMIAGRVNAKIDKLRSKI